MIRFVNITKEQFLDNYPRLYRFIPLERFIEIFENNTITFVNPIKWPDPYEKAFITAKYFLKGKKFELPILNKVYCLCWSGTSSSEAFWKGYSTQNDAVRITISANNLLNLLSGLDDVNVYIGKVKYKKTDEIRELKGKENKKFIISLLTPHIGQQHIELILLKRLAFKYENEIRIILTPKIGYNQDDKDYYDVVINPKELFDSFLLHPKFGHQTTNFLEESFFHKYDIKLKKSNLYQEVKWKINVP